MISMFGGGWTIYSALRNEEATTIKSVIVCLLSLEFLSSCYSLQVNDSDRPSQ